jgi:uncharacterized membrane protein YphA (DoxX/SURF4 family)
MRRVAPAVVRIGIALVFLYFGLSQLRDPAQFVGWLPESVSAIFVDPSFIIVLNGAFEVFFGALLLLGVYTRLSAFLLAAHLAAITFDIGWGQIGVRDFGLTMAALGIALYGDDDYTIDRFFRK